MKLVHKLNVKELAITHAEKIHGIKDLRVSADFINQIEQIVELVIKSNVEKQNDLAKTLMRTRWGNDAIYQAEQKGIINE